MEFKRNQRTEIRSLFKRHILRMVLTRLDFDPLFSFDQLVGTYQKKFISLLPEASIEELPGYDIELTDIKSPKVSLREIVKTFCLANSSEKKKLKFSATSLILEHHKYSSFEEFSSDFKKPLEFVFNQTDAATVFKPKRLGLRKINPLILPEKTAIETFDGYFNKCLTEHLRIPFLSKTLKQDKHVISFDMDDSDKFSVNLQFSTEKGSQNKSEARRFFLDIDVYSTALTADISECLKTFDKMNNLIFDLFLWSIGEKTKSYLEGKGELVNA